MLKEFEETVPIIEKTIHYIETSVDESSPVTILDLCSGFGYLGMFLSELLPPAKVELFLISHITIQIIL